MQSMILEAFLHFIRWITREGLKGEWEKGQAGKVQHSTGLDLLINAWRKGIMTKELMVDGTTE